VVVLGEGFRIEVRVREKEPIYPNDGESSEFGIYLDKRKMLKGHGSLNDKQFGKKERSAGGVEPKKVDTPISARW